ncbi:MAG: hypothetical protein Kow0074_09050 [Candidatus Zixiibacteriota bacterium]
MITVAELDERIERCLAILADNPHSQVFAALAEAYRRRGDFGRAFSVCKSGLKHHPNYAPAHVVMAKLYLHQKMLPDAMASVKKAVEVDGPTRATDLLEAEINLALGDVAAAEPIIDRLRHSEGRNPAVVELMSRLKALRKQANSPATPGENHDNAPDTQTPSAPAKPDASEPMTWEEWGSNLRHLKGVRTVFAWDEQAQVIHPVDATTTGDHEVTALLDAYREVEAELKSKDRGPLRELRIETEQSDLWCGRVGTVIIGLIGEEPMSYGEVRRLATEWYRRVDMSRTADQAGAIENPEQ